MKKLLFLFFFLNVPIQSHQLLESADERVSFTCVFCSKNLSTAEVSLALLIATHHESPRFICEKCRNQKRGKDGQLKKEAIGYKPALGIVNTEELDTGQRSVFRRSPQVQEILFEFYQKRNGIAVVTPLGYRVLAQRRGKVPIFFVKDPANKGYHACKLPTVSYTDKETGKTEIVGLPVDEMIPLVTGNILVTAFGQLEEGALFYRYSPSSNMFHRLKTGELLEEMEHCDKIIAQKQKIAEKKAKNKEILDRFFNALLAKAEVKKAGESSKALSENKSE